MFQYFIYNLIIFIYSLVYNGGQLSFPDIYEFDLDELAFACDLLEVS